MTSPYHGRSAWALPDPRGYTPAAMRSFYTTFEAAHVLGVSLPTVVNWIDARRLKAHRTPGGHRRIAREELAAFMLRQGMPLPAELAGAVSPRRKALVIGPADPSREGIARRLAAAGYAVDQASPGFAAGFATARFDPDVLVLHAEAADGGEVLRAAKLDREVRAIPVVGIGRREWEEPLREAGCAAAVATPLAGEDLLQAVEAALRATGASQVSPPRGKRPRERRRRSR